VCDADGAKAGLLEHCGEARRTGLCTERESDILPSGSGTQTAFETE
jgi:hypothetical protein